MIEKTNYFCEKCHKTLDEKQFYKSNNIEKYPPDGHLKLCKQCLTMHLDNWDPKTYLWIIQELDIPYVREEWDALMATYCKEKSKVKGTTVLGRYISKMKLKQYKDYRWKDNEFLKQLAEKRIREAMQERGYDAAEIQSVIEERNNTDVPIQPEEPEDQPYEATPPSYMFEEEPEEDLGLTEEDKRYLRLKWGKNYKQEEWVWLEQFYTEMMESYDVQTAGHMDTLKLICKTSLKANQLIDIGDVDGYQKVSKVYDSLMKSGNFTGLQNKTEKGQSIDSVSEIVAICEKEGFIPRYYIDEPQDKVDQVLADMKGYTRDLVFGDSNISSLIETSLKQLQEAETKEDDFDDDDEDEEINIDELDYEDYTEFSDFLEEEVAEDGTV